MAKLIKAIGALGPKIIRGRRASMKELVNLIAGRTGLNRGDIQQVVSELREAIIFFALAGRGTKIDGLASYTPGINLEGIISLSQTLDPEVKADLNKPRAFEGEIKNRDMIGKTSQEIIAVWNEQHPEDPVEV